jgi:hypothetical protein
MRSAGEAGRWCCAGGATALTEAEKTSRRIAGYKGMGLIEIGLLRAALYRAAVDHGLWISSHMTTGGRPRLR